MRKTSSIALLILLLLVTLAGCSANNQTAVSTVASTDQTGVATAPSTPSVGQPTVAATAGSPTNPSTVADGKTLLETRCTTCHTLAKIVNAQGTAAQWQQVVDQMIQRGAVLTPDEESILVQYLAANF